MLLYSIYFFGLLVSLLHADEISQFNKQFFDKLGIKDTPVVLKKGEIIDTQQPEIAENIGWNLLHILFNKEDFASEKLYRGGIEALGLEYLYECRYYPSSKKMPRVPREMLHSIHRYHLERYEHCIIQQYEAPWYMKFINEKVGYGIFAAADIKRGDFVGDYIGIIYDNSLLNDPEFADSRYTWTIHNPIDIKGPHFCIHAKKSCNFMRYINHSFDPNVATVSIYMEDQWHQTYVACKDIKKDEQILANYGQGYWTNRTHEKLN